MNTRIFILMLFCFNYIYSEAQISKINWNVIPDSLSLTPTSYSGEASLLVKKKSNISLAVKGEVTISPIDKVVFFIDRENMFKINFENIVNLDFNGYKIIENENFSNVNQLKDTLLKLYRIKLYNKLNLNEVELMLTYKNEYDLDDSGLVVKNPRLVKGKICYISTNRMTLFLESGELLHLNDGDFNYIKLENKKNFKCFDIYNYFFKLYEIELNNTVSEWIKYIKKESIESLIQIYGPIEKSFTLSNDRKLFVWHKPVTSYQINLNSTSTSIVNSSSVNSTYTPNYYNNISPLFYYGNIYRSTTYSEGSSVVSNKQSQSGVVKTIDESMNISVTTDNQNKILNVFQEKLFTNSDYGLPFKFIIF